MRKSLLTLAAFAAIALAGRAQAETKLTIGDATGAAGTTAPFDVTLTTDVEIAGTQNDITPAAGVAINAKPGKCSVTKTTVCLVDADCPETETCKGVAPDCAVNPEIDKTGTSFAFQPSGCQGSACTGVRSLVLSLSNVDAIPTGSVLYTCNVAIPEGTAAGDYALTASTVGASDPAGAAVAATADNGKVVVSGTPPVSDAIIQIGSTSGDIGEEGVTFDVTLDVPEAATEVAGTQNDITFSGGVGAAIEIAAKAGKCSVTKTTACFVDADCPQDETCKGVAPDCTVNPDIDKTGTSFAFQPSGCQGEACTGIRALVLSLSNVDAIPDGSVLYTCVVTINDTASTGTTYPLTCSNAGSSDPGGIALTTSCTDGGVTVGAVAPATTLSADITAEDTVIPVVSVDGFPTSGAVQIGDETIIYSGIEGNTLTGAVRGANGTTAAAHATGDAVSLVEIPPTPTPTVTNTPEVTPTSVSTATHTATPTNTKKPTNTPGGGGFDDDGCAVVAPVQAGNGWLLLLPAAALLWLRRRSK